MNRLRVYIEGLFASFDSSKEVEELKEELLANCEDRYQECIESGQSEAEAFMTVIDSIGDLSGILEEIRKKEGRSPMNLRNSLQVMAASQQESDESETTENYPKEITELEINVTSTDVVLVGTDSGLLEVECGSNMDQHVSGNKLTIQEHTRISRFFGFSISDGSDKDLIVRFPKGLQKVTIHTASGDLNFEKPMAEEWSVTSASGDLNGELAQAERFAIRTASGDLDLSFPGFEQGSITSASGDGHLNLKNDFQDLRIKSASGDYEIDTSRISGAEVNFTSVSGDAEIRTHLIQGTNRIDVTTTSGDLQVF